MGMFDRVWVECPECGKVLELQSKAGDCVLRDYSVNSAPPKILADILGDEVWCEDCRRSYTFQYEEQPRFGLIPKY